VIQLILTAMLLVFCLYAWAEHKHAPIVAILAVLAAIAGWYLVWFPDEATRLANLVGIGRGVDLIIYIWIGISLIAILNLHLKLRKQMELITVLTRALAIAEAKHSSAAVERRYPDI
jgi:small membrane protein